MSRDAGEFDIFPHQSVPRESQIKSQFSRQPREKVRSTNVRHKSNGRFRHGKHGLFRGHSELSVHRDSHALGHKREKQKDLSGATCNMTLREPSFSLCGDATYSTHRNSVDQSNVWYLHRSNVMIKTIFLPKKVRHHIILPGYSGVVDRWEQENTGGKNKTSLKKCESINQSINQSNQQSNNQSINQSTGHMSVYPFSRKSLFFTHCRYLLNFLTHHITAGAESLCSGPFANHQISTVCTPFLQNRYEVAVLVGANFQVEKVFPPQCAAILVWKAI